MASSSFNERLAQERRARLQAEQLLALRSEELYEANRKLAEHADALSTQVIEQREENETLKGRADKTEAQLEVATEKATTAQRRLWDALTATEDGFAIFDRDWRLVAANPAFFDAFDGATDVTEGASYEAILRIAVEEGIVDLQGEAPDDWIDRMIARWETSPIPRIDIKLWNGTYIRLDDKQTPQGDYVSLAIDITQNMRRERQLRTARDAAMAASRAKSAFLANMSHEIRTPMNGVVAMADLLRETDLGEDQQLYADTIRNSGEALLVIINDVLDYSKIEAGKLELREESFDLNAMVREIFNLLQPGIEGKALDLRLDYDVFLPDQIIGDPGRIRQVLTNLIGNATKFTEQGHVTVRILAGPGSDTPEQLNLRVVVEDTGIGIPKDKQAHIFGEFNQAEEGKNRSHDGTGLGLAITQRLVKLMGGSMWLESELGQGSAFGFDVLLRRDPASQAAPVAGLPPHRNHILLIGRGGPDSDHMIDALNRLHAEVTILRHIPTDTDLEGAHVVILGDTAISSNEISEALDSVNFAGPRLVFDGAGKSLEGFEIVDPHMSLGALRARIMSAPWLRDAAPLTTQDRTMASAVEPVNLASENAPNNDAKRPRLLAAEDNKTNQLVFKSMLKGLELDIEIVNNGEELVAAYKRQVPDMIMTDISMPKMDGLEAVRLIRAEETKLRRAPLKIIAMTAHALEEDRERILKAGLDDCVTKPLKKPAIRTVILDNLPMVKAVDAA